MLSQFEMFSMFSISAQLRNAGITSVSHRPSSDKPKTNKVPPQSQSACSQHHREAAKKESDSIPDRKHVASMLKYDARKDSVSDQRTHLKVARTVELLRATPIEESAKYRRVSASSPRNPFDDFGELHQIHVDSTIILDSHETSRHRHRI